MALLAKQKHYIEAWQASGLTKSAYCRQVGLSYKTFTRCVDWLGKHQTRLRTAPKNVTAKAINYALKRWPALTRYAEPAINL
jgi:hypothetical protein